MENIVAVLVLLILVGGSVFYLIRAKRNGVKCVGCPAGGSCSAKHQKNKKKLNGPIIARKTISISGMHCAHCAQSITESLNGIEGVSAKADLSRNCAVVSCDRDISEEVLIYAVEKAGFQVDSIQA